jgi:putative PIN family toxin of toxin-antitoxin system
MKTWVLDTNVIVSGFIKPHGPSARLLDEFFGRRLRLAYDTRIVSEYGEVLARPEFGIEHSDYIGLLIFLRATGEFLAPPALTLDLPDPDDQPLIEVGLASAEKTVVTRNMAHFQPATKLGLRLLLPGEAVRALND